MDTVLSVTGARKSYGATEALRGADLELGRGEWVGLLGPNGAGKTTLVRSVAGRVRLDGGRIELLGATVGAGGSAAGPRRRLGVVPQEVALYPLLTGRENLETFGSLQGLAGAELARRVDAALDWTGLAERADEPVKGFSGGMKRRLNIAASVLHEPEVLLLDEPTVGVDPQSRERIWEMLADLRARGATLLLTTHQLDEAQKVCERIVIIDHGRVIAAGTLAELVAATVGPERRVTIHLEAALEGEPPRGTVARQDGRELRLRLADVADELPPVVEAIGRRGGRIRDLEVEAPSLQAVFLHLTGRELRE